MSSPGQVAGATQQAADQTASTAKDEAAQVGSTAKSAAADVAGTTKEQAGAVAGEAVSQVKDLLDQARGQLTEQAGGAQSKLGESLRTLVDELRSIGDGSGSGTGPAAEVARTLADRGSAVADYISDKQPGELVTDLRRLAARRPGGFLLGALAAGVLAGRLTRGVQAASSSSPSQPATPVPTGDLGLANGPVARYDETTTIGYATDPLADPAPYGSDLADVDIVGEPTEVYPAGTMTGRDSTLPRSTGSGL